MMPPKTIEHKILCSNEAVLQVVEYPGKPGSQLILLLPGSGGGINRFGELAIRLCEFGFRCIAMNYRGAGESTLGSDTTTLSLHDYSADAATVIQNFGRNAVVLGNAFGNRVARCLALDYPHIVSYLVLVCAGGQIPIDQKIASRMQDMTNDKLAREERIAAAAETLFAHGNSVPEWFIDDNRSLLAARLCSDAFDATQSNDWQSGGSAKMLIIQGDKDLIAVPENAQILKKRYPDRVTVQIIENAGHAVLNERTVKVAMYIKAFLHGRKPSDLNKLI